MGRRHNKKGRKVHGILLLDKPLGLSSNKALQEVKQLFKAQKAGHTGSLDPLADGMLPLCFGEATKLSTYLLDADKYYQVTIKLGITTTTADAEGDILEQKPIDHINLMQVKAVIQQFIGEQEQIPPMYSALKQAGQRLYTLARQGIEVERKSRLINIKNIDLLQFKLPEFSLQVHCTKGTYIRTLAEDIGAALGCGAHVSQLRRTAVGRYNQQDMYTLETLKEKSAEGLSSLDDCLLPLDSAVMSLAEVELNADSTYYLRQGQAVMVSQIPSNDILKLYSKEREFLGLGQIDQNGKVAPKKLMVY